MKEHKGRFQILWVIATTIIYQISEIETDISVMGRILYGATGFHVFEQLTTQTTRDALENAQGLPKPSWLENYGDIDGEGEHSSTVEIHQNDNEKQATANSKTNLSPPNVKALQFNLSL